MVYLPPRSYRVVRVVDLVVVSFGSFPHVGVPDIRRTGSPIRFTLVAGRVVFRDPSGQLLFCELGLAFWHSRTDPSVAAFLAFHTGAASVFVFVPRIFPPVRLLVVLPCSATVSDHQLTLQKI